MPRKPKPAGQHVAIYVRVSSASQDTRSQEPDLKHWAAGQDSPVIWYGDKASGATMARPGWEALWAEVQAGRVKAVVCWRIDRLGRTAVGLAKLFEDLNRLGVDLVCVRGGFPGLGTPEGKMIAGILAHVAQYEREVRAERQRAGIDRAKTDGVRFGRPKAVGAAKRIKVRPEQEAAVRRLAAEGKGKAEVARTVGLSRPTIYAIIKNTQKI